MSTKIAKTQIFSNKKEVFSLVIPFVIGLLIWFSPVPNGITLQAWHMLAIFVFTITGIVAKPLPMGAMSLIGIALLTATNTLTIDEALSGFSHNIVWLIVMAFFIAKGFIKTGLGSRVAYNIISLVGKNTLGMSYGILATDLLLAPAIPSLAARSGGVIFPILKALSTAFGSDPVHHPRKLGSFLFLTAFQGSVITGAMFLTSMAGNPLTADIAAKAGVKLTWGTWALAALLPGLVSLIIIPLVLYKFYPPEVKSLPDANVFAKSKLKELGKMKSQEYIMFAVFAVLIFLWISGAWLKMSVTTAALLGFSFLLLTKVLSWEEIINEKPAWDTLIWFSTLIMMAAFLNKFGLTTWFSQYIVGHLQGLDWKWGFFALSFIYFFSHYFFASNVAHIGAMFAPFFFLSVALGAPPMLAALIFCFFSNLFGGLTHYGCAPAPILFGAGYVKIADWWKFGLVFGVLNFVIWMFLGGAWWKLLQLY